MANGFVLDSYCSITKKEKSTDTYLKVAQKIFRVVCFFSPSLVYSVNIGLYSWSSATDYVTNKSRLKINICCLMWLVYFVVQTFFFFSFTKVIIFVTRFYLFISFFFVECEEKKTVLLDIFTRFEYYSQCYMISSKSNHLIGISNLFVIKKSQLKCDLNSERKYSVAKLTFDWFDLLKSLWWLKKKYMFKLSSGSAEYLSIYDYDWLVICYTKV